MPALYRESTDGEDQLLSWTIARPETAGGWYRLDARLRGPGPGRSCGPQLESLVGSLSFEPAPVAPADDRVTLTQIAATALEELRHEPQGRRQFECFDEQAGTRPGVVDELPGMKRLAAAAGRVVLAARRGHPVEPVPRAPALRLAIPGRSRGR